MAGIGPADMADVEAEQGGRKKKGGKQSAAKAPTTGKRKAAKDPKNNNDDKCQDKKCKRCMNTKATTEFYADQWVCKECDADERGWKRMVAAQLGPKWLEETESKDPDVVTHAKDTYVAARKSTTKRRKGQPQLEADL